MHTFDGTRADIGDEAGTLTDLIGYANRRIHQDQDFAQVITGAVGNGKSTLAFHFNTSPLAAWSFSLDQGLSFTGPEWIQKSLDSPKRTGQWLDEPMKGGMGRQWSSPENKDVMKHLVWCRTRHQVHTHLHPDRSWADKVLRSNRFHIWIHVHALGRARLRYSTTHSDFQREVWWAPTEGIRLTFPQATGTLWQEYEKRKDALERRRHELYDTVGNNLGMIDGVPAPIVLDMAESLRPRISRVAKAMQHYTPPGGQSNKGAQGNKPWLIGHR